MTPLCAAEARYRADGTDWLYRCDLPTGHDGPHKDHGSLYQWWSPSATTSDEPTDSLPDPKGHPKP